MSDGQAIDSDLAKGAAESMQRVDAELAFAAQLLADAGFEQPDGAQSVSSDARARIAWNYAYREAVNAWVRSDPDWKRIGGVARCAADVIDAGVAIQVAALAVREGIMPLATAITLHNASVVFGAMRVHLRDWLGGRPQTLAAQRVRASQLKAAHWYPPVQGLVSERLDAGLKVDSIVAEVLEHLKRNPASAPDLPSLMLYG